MVNSQDNNSLNALLTPLTLTKKVTNRILLCHMSWVHIGDFFGVVSDHRKLAYREVIHKDARIHSFIRDCSFTHSFIHSSILFIDLLCFLSSLCLRAFLSLFLWHWMPVRYILFVHLKCWNKTNPFMVWCQLLAMFMFFYNADERKLSLTFLRRFLVLCGFWRW